MTELEKYLKQKKPLVGHEKIRYHMYTKAKAVADRFYADDPKSHEVCQQTYLLCLWDVLEIYDS